MNTSVLAIIVVAVAGAACGGNSATAPPASTSTSTSSGSTQTFSGTLAVQGSSFYSFTVSTAETVSLSLASLTSTGILAASPSVIHLGLGVPLGTDCSVTSAVDTSAGLTAQLTSSINPDVYCVRLSDIGNLAGPMNFEIRIGHNVASSSSSPAATPATFGSFLALGGTSARTFSVSQGGTISLTLTTVSPPSMVGLGIGIPGASASICSLSVSLNASAGSTPQITVPVDAGTYCVEVYDAGSLNAPGAAFSMTIAHP